MPVPLCNGWEQKRWFLNCSTLVGSESKLSSNQTFKKRWQILILFSYTYQKLVQIRKENSWLIRADFELLDTADKVFAYIRKDGDRRFLVVANLSNEEQGLTVEGNVKSVLIENTVAQEVFEKQILAPWDAFCVEMTD